MIFPFGTRVLGLTLRGAAFIFDFYLAISDAKRQLWPLTSSKLAKKMLRPASRLSARSQSAAQRAMRRVHVRAAAARGEMLWAHGRVAASGPEVMRRVHEHAADATTAARGEMRRVHVRAVARGRAFEVRHQA